MSLRVVLPLLLAERLRMALACEHLLDRVVRHLGTYLSVKLGEHRTHTCTRAVHRPRSLPASLRTSFLPSTHLLVMDTRLLHIAPLCLYMGNLQCLHLT